MYSADMYWHTQGWRWCIQGPQTDEQSKDKSKLCIGDRQGRGGEEEEDGGGSGGQTLAPRQRWRKLLSPPSCHGYSKEQLAACVIEGKRGRERRESERENQQAGITASQSGSERAPDSRV